MTHPMVIAYHLIWTAYGWWLPNDPRGSMSRSIRNEMVEELGALHRGRKRIQPVSADIRRFYNEAKDRLCHPLITLDKNETQAVAEAFLATVSGHKYTCYACVIMPDHIHLVIRKHKHKAEQMIANFQSASRLRLADWKLAIICTNHHSNGISLLPTTIGPCTPGTIRIRPMPSDCAKSTVSPIGEIAKPQAAQLWDTTAKTYA